MNDNFIYKIKTIIKILLLILLIIFGTIAVSIIIFPSKKEYTKNNYEYIDNISNNSVKDDNISNDNEILEISEEKKKLIRITDNKKYFLVERCLNNYYAYTDFCIDEIYEQKIDTFKTICYIYLRIDNGSNKTEKLNILLKLDKKNERYRVYTNELLKSNNLLNLKQDDYINLEGIQDDVKEDGENQYSEIDINTDAENCMIDLFQRYKFDLLLDSQRLYDKLDEIYKNERFKTYEEFKIYVNEHKEELEKDKINQYKVYNRGECLEFNGVSESGRHYTFNVNNLMDYTIILDNYVVDMPEYIEIYESIMPSVRAKYCIDRVRQAINDKNYEYVYEKLNIVQKNNYYKNYNDFENFLKTEFFEKNTFTTGEYIMVSDTIYQYEVQVTDETLKSKEIKDFIMTINLRDETDFYISIVKDTN